MSYLERAARLYIERTNSNPEHWVAGYDGLLQAVIADLERFELKLWCLKQAEDTKP